MTNNNSSLLSYSEIFPWQISQWEELIARNQQQRFPHALFFMGPEGLGKKQFAHALAHSLLCNKSNLQGYPCGACHSCHLIRAQSHPDLVLIEPDQVGHMIKVDQIREVVQFINETALQGGYRIVIINPASSMNINSANALLKTLEEPAPNTVLILIGAQNLRLPATIMSRCQKIIFQIPSRTAAIDWLRNDVSELRDKENSFLDLLLNLAEGAPLKAKSWLENDLLVLRQEFYQGLNLLSQHQADPLQLAAKWQEQDLMVLLNLLLIWLQDLFRFHMVDGHVELINLDYQLVFTRLKKPEKQECLLNYLDYVKKIYGHMLSSLNLNRQLLLEELLIRWMQYAC